WLWSEADDLAHHQRRYTRSDLVAKVEAAGLEVLRATSFVSLVLPVLFLSRLRARRERTAYNLQKELSLPKCLDQALERFLTIERRLIAHGLYSPAGGSLLVVARKPAA